MVVDFLYLFPKRPQAYDSYTARYTFYLYKVGLILMRHSSQHVTSNKFYVYFIYIFINRKLCENGTDSN